jgi:hypothetical protein
MAAIRATTGASSNWGKQQPDGITMAETSSKHGSSLNAKSISLFASLGSGTEVLARRRPVKKRMDIAHRRFQNAKLERRLWRTPGFSEF